MTPTERLNETRASLDELSAEAAALLDIAGDDDLAGEALERWDEIQADLKPLKEKEGRQERIVSQIAETLRTRAKLEGNATDRQGTNLVCDTQPIIRARKVKNFLAATHEDSCKAAYRSGMWLIDMVHGGRNLKAREYCEANGIIRAVHIEGSQGAGGALVPTELSNAVIDVRERVAVLRGLTKIESMTSDTKDVPKRLTGVAVTYPGESKTITESDKTWGLVKLSVVKRAILSKISSELREDAIIDVVDDLAGEMGFAFGLQEDNEIVNGDGTATFGGENGLINLLTTTGTFGIKTLATGNTAFEDVLRQDLLDLLALLPEKFHAGGATWLISRSAWNQAVHGLALEQGGSTGLEFTMGANEAGFLGYPLAFTDQMPTVSAVSTFIALFGNWSEALMIGDKRDVRIGVSEDFAFDEDVTTVRGTTRYDINVHEPGTSTTAGAYVGIRTAAS